METFNTEEAFENGWTYYGIMQLILGKLKKEIGVHRMIEERFRFTTNALNRLGENIELLQYGNKFTDGAYTFYCATKSAGFDRWSSEKINAIAALYGCELNDIELSKKATGGLKKLKLQ